MFGCCWIPHKTCTIPDRFALFLYGFKRLIAGAWTAIGAIDDTDRR
jgi:hypothetical protein